MNIQDDDGQTCPVIRSRVNMPSRPFGRLLVYSVLWTVVGSVLFGAVMTGGMIWLRSLDRPVPPAAEIVLGVVLHAVFAMVVMFFPVLFAVQGWYLWKALRTLFVTKTIRGCLACDEELAQTKPTDDGRLRCSRCGAVWWERSLSAAVAGFELYSRDGGRRAFVVRGLGVMASQRLGMLGGIVLFIYGSFWLSSMIHRAVLWAAGASGYSSISARQEVSAAIWFVSFFVVAFVFAEVVVWVCVRIAQMRHWNSVQLLTRRHFRPSKP